MSLILYLIILAISGLVVGALGRLALPGPDPMSITQTILVGIAASFLAGLLSLLIFHGRHGGGILISVLFATGIVYVIRRSRERSGGGGYGRSGRSRSGPFR
jgi:uncharacterized membrane protein YeaQ/YmgE (transglycosylase-associated protein family)